MTLPCPGCCGIFYHEDNCTADRKLGEKKVGVEVGPLACALCGVDTNVRNHSNDCPRKVVLAEFKPTTAHQVLEKIAKEVHEIMRKYCLEVPPMSVQGRPPIKFTVQLDIKVTAQDMPEVATFEKVGFTNG